VGSALKVSEATALAMHTMAVLARQGNGGLSSREIADTLRASQAHLQKVLQRLGRAGLVLSERGPRGGFMLAKQPERIRLLDVYEAVEGPLQLSDCLFGEPACQGSQCMLGGLVSFVNKTFSGYLRRTTVADLAGRSRIGDPSRRGVYHGRRSRDRGDR
jgi:Rrf2 family transcriptional regulator, nitric oxide-sensitive transcriptional repressor